MFHRTNPSEEDCMPKAFAAASMATQKMVVGRHKPMRLGTKSCLECRRRKVRCIVATGTTRCRQCLLHKVRCISQGPSPPAGVLDQEPDQLGGQRKLQLPLSEFPKLKAIFDRLSYHGTGDVSSAKLGPTPADDSVQFSQWLAAALESLLSDEPDKLSSHHYESPSVLATGNNDTSTTSGDGAFATAPLLHYLRTTLVTPYPNERAHSSPVAGTRGSSWQGPARRGSWLSLVPERNFLQSIFIMTQPFWSVWPLSSHFPADIVQACAFMGDELLRCTDGGAAKRLAWLALCISQLPRDFGGHHGFAPMGLRPADLVANLLDASRELAMASIEQSSNSKINSLDSLEALVMQYKCLLSQGRPRQGWKCARAGVDNALLFGLHRTKTAVSLNEREQGIWTALWRADRQMALFLGVPYSVPEHFLGTNERHGSSQQQQAPEDDIFELTMIICGHIVERDHLGSQSAYSQTARIAEDMDKLRSLIPEQWWQQLSLTHSETQEAAPTDTLSSPLGQPFRQSAILFYYHYVNHLVHLPYVVSGREDNRHLYSRSVALESAEGMLLAFMRLPTCNGLPVVCDWLDFATFSGAMVLVVDLLEDEKKQQRQHTESQQTQTQRSISGEGERLWALVAGCAETMRRKADMLGCVVSSQSADLLEHLHAARHGVYVGPEEYEVVIPFFGRVRIRHPRKTQHCQQQQQQQQQGCTMLAQTGYEIFADHETAVEFNWNVSRAQQSAWGDSTMELGEDWAAQIFLPSENDWNATFTLGLAGGYGPESQFLH